MADRFPRRSFLGLLAATAAAMPLALLAPRTGDSAEAAAECSLEDRDLDPYKGFANTRPGSGCQCTTHAARRFDTVAPTPA